MPLVVAERKPISNLGLLHFETDPCLPTVWRAQQAFFGGDPFSLLSASDLGVAQN